LQAYFSFLYTGGTFFIIFKIFLLFLTEPMKKSSLNCQYDPAWFKRLIKWILEQHQRKKVLLHPLTEC